MSYEYTVEELPKTRLEPVYGPVSVLRKAPDVPEMSNTPIPVHDPERKKQQFDTARKTEQQETSRDRSVHLDRRALSFRARK
jgi:hypothetical protein